MAGSIAKNERKTMKFSDYLKESSKPEVHKDFEQWQNAVKNAHPEHAAHLKFKGRIEGGKDTISAEIPGHDRSFGVWDHDEGKGYVLKEENKA